MNIITEKPIQITTLLLLAFTMPVQAYSQDEDEKTVTLRQELGIDYSMPDFSTSRIDDEVIGKRLAGMLQLLKRQGHYFEWGNQLVAVCHEQHANLRFAHLEKFSIRRIIKKDDVITVVIRLRLGPNTAGIRTVDVPVVFNKGVSTSQAANDLFTNLARYIKD